MKSIIRDIFTGIEFAEGEVDYLYSKLKKVTLKKKEYLLSAGEKVDHFSYIDSGCMRTYVIDELGKEHTLQFAIKGWWISDYITLYGNEKTLSAAYIECIKDATLFTMSKKDFDHLCIEMPKVGLFYIKKLESAFAAFQRRILENLTLSAKERYRNFINTYPNIEQSVKNYHIASFLGITNESLSRIRKEIAQE